MRRFDARRRCSHGLCSRPWNAHAPITDTLPKPLVRSADAPCSTMLNRLGEAGVDTRSSTCIIWPTRSRRAWRAARSPKIVISGRARETARPGRRHQEGPLPLIAGRDFFICNTDAVWTEGPRSALSAMQGPNPKNHGRAAARRVSTANAVGVDWPGDFHMAADGRLTKRAERETSRLSSMPASALSSRRCSRKRRTEVFRLAPLFLRCRRCRSPVWRAPRNPGCMSERHRRSSRLSSAYARSSL